MSKKNEVNEKKNIYYYKKNKYDKKKEIISIGKRDSNLSQKKRYRVLSRRSRKLRYSIRL